MAKTQTPKRSEDTNPVVQIAGTIGGMTIALVAIIMLFGDVYKWVAFPVTLCMVLLGIFLGHFARKK